MVDPSNRQRGSGDQRIGASPHQGAGPARAGGNFQQERAAPPLQRGVPISQGQFVYNGQNADGGRVLRAIVGGNTSTFVGSYQPSSSLSQAINEQLGAVAFTGAFLQQAPASRGQRAQGGEPSRPAVAPQSNQVERSSFMEPVRNLQDLLVQLGNPRVRFVENDAINLREACNYLRQPGFKNYMVYLKEKNPEAYRALAAEINDLNSAIHQNANAFGTQINDYRLDDLVRALQESAPVPHNNPAPHSNPVPPHHMVRQQFSGRAGTTGDTYIFNPATGQLQSPQQ